MGGSKSRSSSRKEEEEEAAKRQRVEENLAGGAAGHGESGPAAGAEAPGEADEAAKRQRVEEGSEGEDREHDQSGPSTSAEVTREASSPSSSGDEASPEPKTKPVFPDIPFNLARLEAEIRSLRADPPPYVSGVGCLKRPEMVCNNAGLLVTPSGEGPWDLTVSVSGKEGDSAYGFPFRVSLRFETRLWPSKLATVRFLGVFHHALTDESGAMLTPFYRSLPRDEQNACTVRLVLQAVHTFLVNPLESWKIPVEASLRISSVILMHRKMNEDRFDVIQKYAEKKLHPELFASPPEWKDEWLEPSFLKVRQENTPDAWRSILDEQLPGEVFSFKMLTNEFCDRLVDEILNFYDSGLPARRPNSMNNYGIILNEIGLEPLINELQTMLQPLGEMLFPGPGSSWDGQHCFIVRYRSGEDLGLDMHTDDSDVTFNICLGREFAGAGLQFCGLMGAPNHRKKTHTYQHVKGSCVCHLGRKRHGADDISSGERMNLILWNHSGTYRESNEYVNPPYEKEEAPPDAVCVSYTHDRDFGNYKSYPAGKESFKGRGWCPRPKFEYEGFLPDSEVENLGS